MKIFSFYLYLTKINGYLFEASVLNLVYIDHQSTKRKKGFFKIFVDDNIIVVYISRIFRLNFFMASFKPGDCVTEVDGGGGGVEGILTD